MNRAALFVLAGLAVAAPARAEESSRNLEYAAPAGCPSADDFWRSFATRATHARLSQWALDVRIHEAPGPRFAGTVEVRASDGTVTTRSLDDVSCPDLTLALAVVAAVIVEPEAPTAPAPAPKPEPEPEPVPVPALLPRERWRGRLGLAFASTTHLAPVLSYGGEVFAEIGHDVGTVFAFWLRAVGHVASSGPFDVGSAGASLTSVLGRVEAGGLRFRLVPHLALRLGGALEAGAILGAGRNVDGAEAHWAPWIAVGAVARTTWDLGSLFVELGLGAVVPLTRPRFVAQPGPVVLFEVPVAGAMGELGVGIRF